MNERQKNLMKQSKRIKEVVSTWIKSNKGKPMGVMLFDDNGVEMIGFLGIDRRTIMDTFCEIIHSDSILEEEKK